MNKLDILALNTKFKNKSPEEIVKFAFKKFDTKKITLASSLSIEDQVLTDILIKNNKSSRIFVIDTGRHFQKTYDLMEDTISRYNMKYEIYAPRNQELEGMISAFGPNLFYESQELRKKCCEIRKVKPLNRVLSTVDAWICGLRREQSQTRLEVNIFEWDANHSIYKINPLAFWTEGMVWEYIKNKNVPYSNLYDNGFPSIGCQPCTRVVAPGEDVRSGRWWWESPDKKECGLHIPTIVNDKI